MSTLLEQYDFNKYSDIAKEVKKILSDALKKQKEAYSLFGITARAKSRESLEQKISKNNINTLDFIKDLAGCRVVFFYNHDVRKFKDSNIVYDNFELLEYTHHHRTSDLVDDVNELYTAVHYVVNLKSPNRLSLKYIEEDLKCEIQIHTLLNHAYSETTHNITYKQPHNLIIGKKALEEINDEFKNLMQKYLLPAGHYQDIIMKKHQEILKANDLASNIIQNIQNASCISDITDILDQWKKDVAKYYNNRETIYDHAVKIIDCATEKWRSYKQDIDAEILLVKIIEILVYLTPLDFNYFFSQIVKLYQVPIEKSTLGKINEYLVYITRYHSCHIENNNYKNHTVALDFMSEWNNKILIKMIDFVCLLCREILQLEIIEDDWVSDINYYEPSKSTSAVKIRPISFDPLPDEVKKLRSRTIAFLIKLYSLKGVTRQQKEELILVLSDAAKLPMHTTYKTSLSKTVISNLVVIVKFYTRILPQESFLSKLIYNKVFKFRHLAVQLAQQKGVKNSAQALLNSTDVFKNELTKIKNFEIYNTLLSGTAHGYIDDVQWKDPLNYLSNFKKIEEDIKAKTLEYTSLLNLETEEDWEKIIIECVVNKGGYLLREFLYRLGIDQPLFALNLLYKYETTLLDYLISIFNGLLSSEETQQTKNLLKTWIIQGKYLELVVNIYMLDYFLVNLIYEKAKNENNLELLRCILKNQYQDEINRQFVLPIIEIFTKTKVALDCDTITHVISVINNQDLEKILENLLHCKKLDQNYLYSIENITSRKPEVIIPFFQKVFYSSSTAVIYDFHEAWSIGEYLTELLDNLNHYTDLSPKLFSFLFSIKNKKVQNLLHKLIDTRDKITFIVKLLGWYEKRGLNANNNIEEILDVVYYLLISNNELSYSIIKELKGMITFVSNVVVGNYGDSEAYKSRQVIIEKWQKCNTRVKDFTESVDKKLDQIVKSERSREELQAIMN